MERAEHKHCDQKRLVALALALLTMLLVAGSASADLPKRQEAETGPKAAYGAPHTDEAGTPTGASPNSYRLTANGSVRFNFTVSQGEQVQEVAVRAKLGEFSATSANLVVAANGTNLGTRTLALGDTSLIARSFAANLGPGNHTIDVKAQNMQTGDRLIFDWVELRGTNATPPDADGDGVADASDNCPSVANAGQTDTDGDGQGDACDITPNGQDADGDGVPDSSDNCPNVANAGQTDSDGDGQGNSCDSTQYGPGPDSDDDDDGRPDATDYAPQDPNVRDPPAGQSCDLNQRIASATAGATIDLPDGCVERSFVTVTKNLTIIGGPGVSIRGTDVWGDWTSLGNGNWRSTQSVPAFTEPTTTSDPNNPNLCESGTTCDDVEMVFADDTYTQQLNDGADPAAGQFALDASRRVVLGFEPTGKIVEVAERQIVLNASNKTVTLQDINVTRVASYRQSAAAKFGTSNVTLNNVDVSWTHGSGLSCGGSASCVMTGSLVEDTGTVGVSSNQASFLDFSGNTVRDNGHLPDANYNDSFESGGIKVTNYTAGSVRTVENNVFYNNTDRGIWLDVGADDVTVRNNIVSYSDHYGIHVEISDNVRVYGNRLWENGWPDGSLTGGNAGGVYNSGSSNVKVYQNVLAWNNDGIAYIGNSRNPDKTGNEAYLNTVILESRPNTEKNLAMLWQDASGADITPPAGVNLGHDNDYWFEGGETTKNRFQWKRSGQPGFLLTPSLSAYNNTPGEQNGQYITDAAKDQILTANGMPLQPDMSNG